jgi:hypothetical protein
MPEKKRQENLRPWRRFGPVFYQASQSSEAKQVGGLARVWPAK